MSIEARIRPERPGETLPEPPATHPPAPRPRSWASVWPLAALAAGALLSMGWTVLLLWLAYSGLMWLASAG